MTLSESFRKNSLSGKTAENISTIEAFETLLKLLFLSSQHLFPLSEHMGVHKMAAWHIRRKYVAQHDPVVKPKVQTIRHFIVEFGIRSDHLH